MATRGAGRFPVSIKERWVFTDSSAFLALFDEDDRYYQQAAMILHQAAQSGLVLFTTNLVIVETHALLNSHLGHSQARRWLAESRFNIVRVEEEDEVRAREIILQYADKDFSLCDACSFAVMERLGVSQAFAFDNHFLQYGWTLLQA